MKNAALSLVLLVSATGASAQQRLTEKVDVNLVNVDVTVTSHGAPAHGLTADDFEVREDGVPQSELTHNLTLRLRRGRQHMVVVAIHDQVSDGVAHSSRELAF